MIKRYLPKIICALQLLQIYPARYPQPRSETIGAISKHKITDGDCTSLLQDTRIKGAFSGKGKSEGLLYIWKTVSLTEYKKVAPQMVRKQDARNYDKNTQLTV